MGRISKELLEKLPCSGEEVSYTVRVDCSGRNLTSFPTLPSDSTVLDLSHNLLDQVGFLKVVLADHSTGGLRGPRRSQDELYQPPLPHTFSQQVRDLVMVNHITLHFSQPPYMKGSITNGTLTILYVTIKSPNK